jgi:tetratricopeptide (TPR) repeat protein
MGMGLLLAATLMTAPSLARGQSKERGQHHRSRDTMVEIEKALDAGRAADACADSDRLQRSHGLGKAAKARLELIAARCDLLTGKFVSSERVLAKIVRGAPEDARLNEWYARALDGAGKSDAAYALLRELAQKDALAEGDSYWALAQLERQKGETQAARAHARLALQKPIALPSDDLDHAIHQFIDELQPKKQ